MNAFETAPIEQENTKIPLTIENFKELAKLVKKETGINLTENKRPLVYSRLISRVKQRKAESFDSYLNIIKNPDEKDEMQELISALTTNVTNFFREEHHFEALRNEVLTPNKAKLMEGERFRIWSAGCSTGQEPYCIAMSLFEVLGQTIPPNLKILATDIDPKIVSRAKAGEYPEADLANVSAARKSNFFAKSKQSGQAYRISDEVKSLITFAELNLVSDWPIKGPFDVIMCRNVAIYFDHKTQEKLWDRFCNLLKIGGYLFIGHSERITGPAANKLQPAGITTFRKVTD